MYFYGGNRVASLPQLPGAQKASYEKFIAGIFCRQRTPGAQRGLDPTEKAWWAALHLAKRKD
jgi:hypothetical protein